MQGYCHHAVFDQSLHKEEYQTLYQKFWRLNRNLANYYFWCCHRTNSHKGFGLLQSLDDHIANFGQRLNASNFYGFVYNQCNCRQALALNLAAQI